MRRKLFFGAVILGSFFVCQNLLALNSDIVINEIGAYEGAGQEWVEIWNSGSDDVDLTDWKFWEDNTNHGLSVSSTDFILSSGEYGAICQDEEIFLINNPSFSGSVFDSSWGTLKEDGEEIGLKDSVGNFIEQFSYVPASNFSLERINPFLADYTISNWQEHASGNTLGAQNSVYNILPVNVAPTAVLEISTTSAELGEDVLFSGLNSSDSDGNIISWLWDFGDGGSSSLASTTYSYSTTGTFNIFLTVADDDSATSTASTSIYIFNQSIGGTTTTPTSTPTTSTASWGDIKINEVVSDPESGNEMVEFFNITSTSFDLTGGTICDSTESSCKTISGVISGDGFFIFDLGTTRYLNNDGDFVILKDDLGNKIDEISYGGSIGAPEKGESLARRQDGVDTDDFSDWAITISITLGSANVINEPVSNPPAGGGGSNYVPPVNNIEDNDNSDEQGGSSECSTSSSVVIYEILPNPAGDDSQLEYIKIKNLSSSTINLNGWILKDLSREFELSGEILAGEILEFNRTTTSIALNNTGYEEVSLIDVCVNVIDKLSYEEAEEDFVLRYENGERKWNYNNEDDELSSEALVKDENDSLPDEAERSRGQIKIVWSVDYPQTILKGDKVWFDAGGSADPRGGNLEFAWQFVSSTLFGEKQEFKFNTTGTFKIFIFATSSAGTVGQTEIEVLVGERLASESDVFISEVFANPEGVDTREYVKIKNSSATTTEISNYELKYNGKVYQIPDNTFIELGRSLTFYKAVTKFSLSNSGGVVELWNELGNLVDSFEFAKSGQGEVITEDLRSKIEDLEKQVKEGISKIASTKKVVQSLSLEEVRLSAQAGDLVRTKGTVIALPGILGSQYFYIFDGKFGIQIYSYYKDFPDLKIGDLIQVEGEISIASGVKRIKVKTRNEITPVKSSASAEVAFGEFNRAMVIDKIDELNENLLGDLINIEGEITEIKSSYLYLDDGSGEIKVYFKPGARINTSDWKVGQILEVNGVLELSSGGFQLWPRLQDDIVIASEAKQSESEQLLISANNSKKDAENYLVATGGGITALILGFVARARGLMALGFLKKAVVAVGKVIIRRG